MLVMFLYILLDSCSHISNPSLVVLIVGYSVHKHTRMPHSSQVVSSCACSNWLQLPVIISQQNYTPTQEEVSESQPVLHNHHLADKIKIKISRMQECRTQLSWDEIPMQIIMKFLKQQKKGEKGREVKKVKRIEKGLQI